MKEGKKIITEAQTNTVGAEEYALTKALSKFEEWNDITGFVIPMCGYWAEIRSLIEDAVRIGLAVAFNDKKKLKDIMRS